MAAPAGAYLATPSLDKARDGHLHVGPLVGRGEKERLPEVMRRILHRISEAWCNMLYMRCMRTGKEIQLSVRIVAMYFRPSP